MCWVCIHDYVRKLDHWKNDPNHDLIQVQILIWSDPDLIWNFGSDQIMDQITDQITSTQIITNTVCKLKLVVWEGQTIILEDRISIWEGQIIVWEGEIIAWEGLIIFEIIVWLLFSKLDRIYSFHFDNL